MRKSILMAMIFMVALITSTGMVYAGHESVGTGITYLHPANNSGVQGTILFEDNGTTLTVMGTATGLSGGEISLVYDNGSVPGGPGTDNVAPDDTAQNPSHAGICEPSDSDDLSSQQMIIGPWVDQSDGTWSLGPIQKTGDFYVPLSDFDTVSIRTAPGAENVLACGQVGDHPAGP